MQHLRNTAVTATVNKLDTLIRACVEDQRPDTVELFDDLDPTASEQLAVDAWTIGLRALGNAYSRARESRLEDVGRTLLGDMERQLKAQLDLQQRSVAEALGRYFDPADGEVNKRLAAFVDDEGVLARFLGDFLGSEHSVLAKTLAEQVGANSELFKRLSPSEKHGLVSVLEERLGAVMRQGHQQLVRALDPLAEDGAIARMLRTLRKELDDAEQDRTAALKKATAALDANDETSLLSRLARETREAKDTLLRALNPEHDDSPLRAVKVTVETMLAAHGQTQKELLLAQEQRQKELETLIRETTARLDARKQADAVSPRGGASFEDAVVGFVTEVTRGGSYVVEATGSTTGQRRACKVGDVVVEFAEDSAFAGCRVVVEAKRDRSYTEAKALEEMVIARENRNASVGVFVYAASHAPDGFPGLVRYGSTILTSWDPDDPSTAPMLRAALLAALAMATRRKTDVDQGDLTALRDIEIRIHNEVGRIVKMHKANDRITSGSDEIRTELDRAKRSLERLLDKAKDTLRALSVELVDEEAEVASPISLPYLTATEPAASGDVATIDA